MEYPTQMEIMIKESILSSPLSLLTLNKKYNDLVNNYLPYSVGFEIECSKKETFNIDNFKYIPDIMEVNCDSGEQRFRIPNGLKGIICLYNISQQLTYNSELNPLSGIHYHIDCTEKYAQIKSALISNKESVLRELDSWEYKGKYNIRDISLSHNWIRLNIQFSTAEFRIGEMTFDYKLLIKRILHCTEIIRKIKEPFKIKPVYTEINKSAIFNYLKTVNITSHTVKRNLREYEQLLQDLETPLPIPQNDEDMEQIIKNRQIKL